MYRRNYRQIGSRGRRLERREGGREGGKEERRGSRGKEAGSNHISGSAEAACDHLAESVTKHRVRSKGLRLALHSGSNADQRSDPRISEQLHET